MDCINIGYYFVADWCWISMKLRVSTPISSASVELLVFSFCFWLGQGVDRAFSGSGVAVHVRMYPERRMHH